MNSRRRKMKQIREENNNNGKKADKMHVKEWLHQNARRPVKVKFGPDENFYLLNRKGDKLRTIKIKNIESMVVEVTQDTNKKPMLLLRVFKDHDLVLEFSYIGERKKFLAKLENFLTSHKKNLETVPCFRDHMLMNAETAEKRKLRLEHFFREAYALTFGLKPGEKRKFEEVTSDVIMVMRTTLSKKEFASALGKKYDLNMEIQVKRLQKSFRKVSKRLQKAVEATKRIQKGFRKAPKRLPKGSQKAPKRL